jgi:hypothetical protein
MDSSALIYNEGPTVAVRVRPGWTLQSRDDLAPDIPVMWGEGEEIPNLAKDEVASLIELGAVELI